MKLAENQAQAKQHPEAELLLFKNYSLSLSRYHPKLMRHSKNCTKKNCDCCNEIIWLITLKMKVKMKDKSDRYDIYRTRQDMVTNKLNVKCVSV